MAARRRWLRVARALSVLTASPWRARSLWACLAGSCLLVAPRAQACGVSASGVSSCSLAEHDEAVRPRWAVGASGLYTVTRLRFSGGLYADQVRYATLGSLAYLPTPKLVLQVGAGAAFRGSLRVSGEPEYRFSAGPTLALGADYRAFDDGRYFLMLTSSLSFSAARTHRNAEPSQSYQAYDLRLGAEFGLTLAELLRPYLLARAFGGPVFWTYHEAAVSGTDTHHYQLGLGAAVRLSKTLSLFAEAVPLGERALSAGLGLAL
jgi:hypothetical protein